MKNFYQFWIILTIIIWNVEINNFIWLDEKIENIAVNDPIILKKNGGPDCYGIVDGISFEMASVKTRDIQWISEDPAGTGETLVYSYTILVQEGGVGVERTYRRYSRSGILCKLGFRFIHTKTPAVV